ncbi:methionyl-tRNA formyltransferase [Mycoplasmopsis opalescens]|uniref:methionyl-tRNA formyltransferase n=1 Tax=Mycoplasmopsis opalescens TaxID=114886 RepID=UPI0004A728C5|nr:methionyl-tRNA formyltransferase [Mycoplasmopsis opalescens]
MIKILLAGTPEFSVPIFEEIINNFNVVGIVSQPDKPTARGRIITHTPTKKLGEKFGIKVFQPNKIGEITEELRKLDYDYLVTCAFGQFIPTKVLALAKKYNLNIHGSLLPKYRGASPIQSAVLNGDNKTGITLMEMVKEMDAGDIFFQKSCTIDELDTASSIFNKLQKISIDHITEWIKLIDKGEFNKIAQNSSEVTFCTKLEREDAEIKEDLTIDQAQRIIKGYDANGCAYAYIMGKRVKIYKAQNNYIVNAPTIKLSDGVLYLTDYQFESKRRVIL